MDRPVQPSIPTESKDLEDRLLGESSLDDNLTEHNLSNNDLSQNDLETEALEWEELDPLESEEIATSCHQSQPFTVGEIPTVKSRFEAILKSRLKAEIQADPPVFPWETGAAYTTYLDVLPEEQVPGTNLWASHRQNLRWSASLPETVFAQLLTPCQTVLQSSLREGAKLVKAVEDLISGSPESLDELAGLVALGPARTAPSPFQPQYEEATADQQTVILLLAAQEIMHALTLDCVLGGAVVEQKWGTAMGVLTIEAEYVQESCGTVLKVLGSLPDGGRLLLTGEGTETVAQRDESGYLKLELVDPQPGQAYRLNVLFHAETQNPLSFVVRPDKL
ncbi:MAG: hypothetical protein ACFBSC_18360 [Microcoleaceae cyanobacterium]